MESKSNHLERFKNLVSDFQKALECPVCLEIVKKPFKQCSRGHLICVSCIRNFTTCPTCKEELLLENPVCIQNLLECLPRSCRYSGDGCEEVVEDGNDHERLCGFRRVTCKANTLNCKEKILAKYFKVHMQNVHPQMLVAKEHNSFTARWPRFGPGTIYTNCLYIHFFDNLFCISLDNNDKKQLQIMFQSFPVGQLDGDFYAKVSFVKGDISYVFTLKAFPAGENEQDSELVSDEAEINRAENFCMKIPQSMLSNFIDNEGNLVHELLVFKV